MSAEVLRRAVDRMRADAEACGDSPGDFIPAVASWLDNSARHARRREQYGEKPTRSADPRALAVARAYLGDDA